MKYEHTAKGIAALGRNGDDTLMHVNKEELAGLQALLGPVTINPETGLPEAFNWSSVLSSVGIGLLGALTGGAAAPALGALGATAVGAGTGALAGGALSAAQGKGFGPGAIGGALSGGMGGYGGAGLTSAPASTAAAATEAPVSSGLSGAMTKAAESAVPKTVMGPTGFVDIAPTAGAPGSIGADSAISKLYPSYTGAPATAAITPNIASAYPTNTIGSAGIQTTMPAAQPSFATGAGTPSYWDAIKSQGSSMMSKEGMSDLLKPVGLGAMLGSTVQDSLIQDANYKKQQEQAQAQAQANTQDQQNYFASLGFPLPAVNPSTSPDTATQRNYYLDLVYPTTGMAAGGPVTASRLVMGVPVQTTFPAHIVDEFERSDPQKEIPEAFQGLQQLAGDVGLAAQKADARHMAHGGYLNNTLPAQEDPHPQSLIPKAQPHPGAAPVRQEVVQAYSDGGSVYEEGGFLEGPGDGMSDNIEASIDGQEEVRLADGEFVIPPEIVRMLGYGDPEKGSKLLDNLLPMVRQAAHGKKEQVKQDAAKQVVTKALGGLPQSGKKSLAAEKAEKRKARG